MDDVAEYKIALRTIKEQIDGGVLSGFDSIELRKAVEDDTKINEDHLDPSTKAFLALEKQLKSKIP